MLSVVYAMIVCLCVCTFVTLQYCIKTAHRRITQIMPRDGPGTLVFWHQSLRRNSNRSFSTVATNAGGVGFRRL